MEEFTLHAVPQECPPAAHLYLAVAGYGGAVTVQTMHSIIGAITILQEAGVKITTNFVAGCCYIDHTRNLLAKHFMDSVATDMLFVDADVGFGVDAALKIASAKKPLVAGVYPKKGETVQWPVTMSQKLQLDSDGTIEVPLMPTGFMRINRKVFEHLDPHCKHYTDAQVGRMTAYFETTIQDETETAGGVFWGEDYNLCRKWTKLGGKGYIIPDITFSHTGSKSWNGNLMQWLRENATSAKVVDIPKAETPNA